MDIKVPLDVCIETLRAAAREGDSFQWSLGQFEWLPRNFRISNHSAVYEPEDLGAKPAFAPPERESTNISDGQLYKSQSMWETSLGSGVGAD